jgi:hypothetical protein
MDAWMANARLECLGASRWGHSALIACGPAPNNGISSESRDSAHPRAGLPLYCDTGVDLVLRSSYASPIDLNHLGVGASVKSAPPCRAEA